jgi:hypothetical protein
VCGAGEQTLELPPGTDLSRHIVLAGTVLIGPEPNGTAREALGGAFVRLLDRTGEFTAEVVSSASGAFRFFAAPGDWTIRALHPCGTGETPLSVPGPGLFSVEVIVS